MMHPVAIVGAKVAGGFEVIDYLGVFDAAEEKKRTRLILLGTKGGPSVGKSGRSNPSTVILINDVPYVVDCGYGVSRQLISAGVALNRVRYISSRIIIQIITSSTVPCFTMRG